MTTEPLDVTDALLDEVDRLCEAASPREDHAKGRTSLEVVAWNQKGDWAVLYDDCDLCAVVEDNPGMGCWASDYARLFAFSRAALPALAAEVRRLRALAQSLADRVAGQSEILSRRAEKGGE